MAVAAVDGGGRCGCGAWALGRMDFGSSGKLALLLRGMGDPLGPGIEPMSPALAGRFLTTGPPGKSQDNFRLSQDMKSHNTGKVFCLIYH